MWTYPLLVFQCSNITIKFPPTLTARRGNNSRIFFHSHAFQSLKNNFPLFSYKIQYFIYHLHRICCSLLKSFSGCAAIENIFPHEKSSKMLPENMHTCLQLSNFVRVTFTFSPIRIFHSPSHRPLCATYKLSGLSF